MGTAVDKQSICLWVGRGTRDDCFVAGLLALFGLPEAGTSTIPGANAPP